MARDQTDNSPFTSPSRSTRSQTRLARQTLSEQSSTQPATVTPEDSPFNFKVTSETFLLDSNESFAAQMKDSGRLAESTMTVVAAGSSKPNRRVSSSNKTTNLPVFTSRPPPMLFPSTSEGPSESGSKPFLPLPRSNSSFAIPDLLTSTPISQQQRILGSSVLSTVTEAGPTRLQTILSMEEEPTIQPEEEQVATPTLTLASTEVSAKDRMAVPDIESKTPSEDTKIPEHAVSTEPPKPTTKSTVTRLRRPSTRKIVPLRPSRTAPRSSSSRQSAARPPTTGINNDPDLNEPSKVAHIAVPATDPILSSETVGAAAVSSPRDAPETGKVVEQDGLRNDAPPSSSVREAADGGAAAPLTIEGEMTTQADSPADLPGPTEPTGQETEESVQVIHPPPRVAAHVPQPLRVVSSTRPKRPHTPPPEPVKAASKKTKEEGAPTKRAKLEPKPLVKPKPRVKSRLSGRRKSLGVKRSPAAAHRPMPRAVSEDKRGKYTAPTVASTARAPLRDRAQQAPPAAKHQKPTIQSTVPHAFTFRSEKRLDLKKAKEVENKPPKPVKPVLGNFKPAHHPAKLDRPTVASLNRAVAALAQTENPHQPAPKPSTLNATSSAKLKPTVPHTPKLATEERLKERSAFDDALRRKEEEKQKAEELAREEEEMRKDAEVKEYRKLLDDNLRANVHEVPEWYNERPKAKRNPDKMPAA